MRHWWKRAIVFSAFVGLSASRGAEAAPEVTRPASAVGVADAAALAMWRDFVRELRQGAWPDARFRVYPELAGQGLEAQLKKWLRAFRTDEVALRQFDGTPRVYRVGSNVHYLVAVTRSSRERYDFVFTLAIDDGRWYVRSLESLQAPLYEIPALPTSSFPDVSEESKHWRRAEILVTKNVALWNALKRDKGEASAFDWFKDGVGYLVGVKTWLPYFEPAIAFPLYVSWEQSILWGEPMTLVSLDPQAAMVRFDRSIYFRLYHHTGHLVNQIGAADYRRMFETVWIDRCQKAGWSVTFEYRKDDEVVELHLTRAAGRQ